MKTRASRWGSRGGQLLLTLTAVVGVLCALLAVLAVAFGVRPVVFRSGSMEPAVGTGALGFSRTTPAADLKVGDIVTVINAQKKTITHRIVAIGPGARSTTLRLKGDDNPVPDQEIYRVTEAPKLWFSVPDGGYVVAWFAKAPGSYLLGGYVVMMLMIAFRRRQDSDSTGGSRIADLLEMDSKPLEVVDTPTTQALPPTHTSPRRRRRGPAAAVTAVAIVALASAMVAGWSRTTWAAWNDGVAVTGTTIKTGIWGDTTAPTTTVSQAPAANGAGWNNSNVTLTFVPTDPAVSSGIQKVEYRTSLNGGAFSVFTSVTVSPYTAVISAEGTTVVEYRATDNAGNVETPNKSYTVKIDKTAPSITAIDPANGTSGSAWENNVDCSSATDMICVTATDTGGSGVASSTVKVVRTSPTLKCWDGTNGASSFNTSGSGCAANPMTLVAGVWRSGVLHKNAVVTGTYQVTVVVTDVAGNSVTSVTTFTIT